MGPIDNTDAIDEAQLPSLEEIKALLGKSRDFSDNPEALALTDSIRMRKDEDTTPAPTETERHDQPPTPPPETTHDPLAMLAQPTVGMPSLPTIPVSPHPAADAPDWNKLLSDLQGAEQRAGNMRTVQSALATASPNQHFHADPNAGQADIAAAKAPLELAQARQGFEHTQSQMDAAKSQQAAGMAAKDPNSPQSQKARAALQSFFGSTGLLPPNFDSYSASDVEKFAGTLTPLAKQQGEERIAGDKAKESAGARAASLADRKKTMLSLYPEHAQEINALNDLGDAQTLQTALEGRAGREQSATNSATEAAIASKRALGNQIALKEYEATHKSPTAEQLTQLEGINKSDGALDVFEKGLGSTSTMTGKIAANFPKAAGAIGAEGADFDSLRKGTAVALARGLEGGTARPGNIEIIDSMLPEASDAPEVKAHKMANVRAFVKNNREAFMKTAQTGGTNLQSDAGVPKKTWRNKKTGKTVQGTEAELKASKSPGDWEPVGG